MNKEQKIASFQEQKNRLQLLKITTMPKWIENDLEIAKYLTIIKYQVRFKRKVIITSTNEYECRKVFATYAQNMILQLKIY